MELAVFAFFGLVGWFLLTWLRRGPSAAMQTPVGRFARWAGATSTGAAVSIRAARRGLSEEHHQARMPSEVIEVAMQNHRPARVTVCADSPSRARARVLDALPTGMRIADSKKVRCKEVRTRVHVTFDLRRQRLW